jgi:hypothetical protein
MTTSPGDTVDVAIVGAGVAGLACARVLIDAGLRVVVLEKSRGVGGRCATRRMMGQPVDFGLAYYHADDDDLLAALAAVPAAALPGWPHRVVGGGPPCHPASFRAGQRRLAFEAGVNVFPKHLAQGLPVRLATRVTRLRPLPTHVALDLEDSPPQHARDVVLTLPAPQARALLPDEDRRLRAVQTVLDAVQTDPAITLVLGYDPARVAAPAFDVLYPEPGDPVRMVAHDSAKRADPAYHVLVVQAEPGWSRARLEDPPDGWRAALLAWIVARLGPWAADPAWSEVHRWRYAKVELSTEMVAPATFGLPGGGRLGLASEAFTHEAGVQGAFQAGRRLARRLLAERGAA